MAKSTSSSSSSPQKCPCGSGATFISCCGRYLPQEGKKATTKPETAEQLMRARYSAYTLADVDFIEETTDPGQRGDFDREGTAEWAKRSEWLGLRILNTEAGGALDKTGIVEFVASFRLEGVDREHHERAEFRKRDNQWYFYDGKIVQVPYVAGERVGRNDPCTCGSGKKFKKCCGKAA